MGSRALIFSGFFIGNMIYRSIRDGGATWGIVVDSAAVALITIGLLEVFEKLRRRRQG